MCEIDKPSIKNKERDSESENISSASSSSENESSAEKLTSNSQTSVPQNTDLSEDSDEEFGLLNTKKSKIENDYSTSTSKNSISNIKTEDSKAIFGSAAKSIVSFSSISGSSTLPVKSLFADISSTKIEELQVQSLDVNSNYEVFTGEEDEITISSMKGKLFEFNSSAKDWVEKGIGFIKLNKSQENEKYRLLMRLDGIQKLILNSRIFNDMNCEVIQGKNVRFSAYNQEHKIQTFLFRMKNDGDAKHLLNSIEEALKTLDVAKDEGC